MAALPIRTNLGKLLAVAGIVAVQFGLWTFIRYEKRRAESALPPPSAAAAAVAPVPPAPRTLTLAFWNLNWFPGRKPHAGPEVQASHVAAVLPVVEGLNPDVFGMEEIAGRDAAQTVVGRLPGFKVDVCSEFLRGPEQKRTRKKKHTPAPSADEEDEPDPDATPPPVDTSEWTFPDRQQMALCSRLPVLATGAETWKPGASIRRQRRGFVWAVYRTAPGEVVLVYDLHLKSNVVDEAGGAPTNVLMREEAARQFLAHQRANAAAWSRAERLALVVVGGDMNTSLDEPKFAAETTLRTLLGEGGFLWGWRDVPLLRRLTLPAKGRYLPTCFDHVLYRRVVDAAGRPQLASMEVVPTGPKASDHRPVVARFAW